MGCPDSDGDELTIANVYVSAIPPSIHTPKDPAKDKWTFQIVSIFVPVKLLQNVAMLWA